MFLHNKMSDINHNLQFQLLHLHGSFSATFYAATNAARDVASYAALIATSNTALNVAYDAAYDAASHATDYAASNAAYSAASNAAYNVAFNAALNAAKKENFDVVILVAFKEVIKLDEKIQEEIKSRAMVKILSGYKSPRSEKELVESLLNADTPKMLKPIQTYWMYSIWHCILCMMEYADDSADLLFSFERKRKELTLPDKYMELLTIIDPEYLSSVGGLKSVLIRPLIAIVSGYHGLKDREEFLRKLIDMD